MYIPYAIRSHGVTHSTHTHTVTEPFIYNPLPLCCHVKLGRLRSRRHVAVLLVGLGFWCFVMLSFLLYVFAVMFLQAMADVIAYDSHTLDPETVRTIEKTFGSMLLTMLSLYKSVGWRDK